MYVRTYIEQQGREDPEVSVHHPQISLEDSKSKNSKDTSRYARERVCVAGER